MFRRFMIVCWVLFGLAIVTSAAGWGIYKYSYTQILTIRDSAGVKPEYDQPEQIADALVSIQAIYTARIQLLEADEPDEPMTRQEAIAESERRLKLDSAERAAEPDSIQRALTYVSRQIALDRAEKAAKPFLEEEPDLDKKTIPVLKEIGAKNAADLDTVTQYGGRVRVALLAWEAAIVSALAILLWNVLWHIGHWIREGRKEQGPPPE